MRRILGIIMVLILIGAAIFAGIGCEENPTEPLLQFPLSKSSFSQNGNTVQTASFNCQSDTIISANYSSENNTIPESVFDNDLNTYFESSHDNWQYIDIDFGCPISFSGLRRYMSENGSGITGNRNLNGETIRFSLDGRNWVQANANNTSGWENYVNYGSGRHAWHSLNYGWSEAIVFNQVIAARYIRFYWDGKNDLLHEIEILNPCPFFSQNSGTWTRTNSGFINKANYEEADHLATIDIDPHSGLIYSVGTTIPMNGTNQVTRSAIVTRKLANGGRDNTFVEYHEGARIYIPLPDRFGRLPTRTDLSTYYGIDGLVPNQGEFIFLMDAQVLYPGFRENYKKLVKFLPNGEIDDDFRDLKIKWPEGRFRRGGSITIDNQQNVYVGGHNDKGFWVSRFLSENSKPLPRNGELDLDFGNEGYSKIPTEEFYQGEEPFLTDIIIDNEGRVLIGGIGRLSNRGFGFYMVRLTYNGTIDTSFGNNGDGLVKFFGGPEYPTSLHNSHFHGDKVSILVLPNNDILVAYTLDLQKFNSDGILDTNFGNNGVIHIRHRDFTGQVGTQRVLLQDLILTRNNKILTVGMPAHLQEVVGYSFNLDGTPNLNFGVNGKIHLPELHRVSSVKIRPDGLIMLGGQSYEVVRIRNDLVFHWDFSLVVLCED